MEIILELGEGLSVAKAQIAELKEQSQNARLMPKEMFNTLVRNVQRRKQLESLPYCAEVDEFGKTRVEIVSGHHRVRAARAAGMREIFILLDHSGLTRSQIVAKQLAHNSIAGEDDATVLAELFSRITDANDKLEAYINEESLKFNSTVPLVETSIPVEMKTVTFSFFPKDLETFNATPASLQEKLALCDEMFCVRDDQMEIFKAAIAKAIAETKIKSPGVAFSVLCEKILGMGKPVIEGQEEIRFEIDVPNHPFSDIMVRLFRQCEVEQRQVKFKGYPTSLAALCNIISGMPLERRDEVMLKPVDFLMTYIPSRQDTVLVPFTGGKDCVATALKLSKEMGKAVELFHVIGMNNSYRDEELANSERLAAKLGMKLHTAEFFKPGRGPHHGNPVRNMMLLSLAADKAMELGIAAIAAGNPSRELIEHIDYHWGISDSIEMHTAFSEYIHAATNNSLYCYPSVIRSETDSYCIIAKYAPEILDEVSGCMTPGFYRKNHHDRNVAKFKVALKDTRCGSCHKCITEFTTLSLLGVIPENQAYFEYCKQAMVRRMKKEHPTETYTIEQAWQHYVDDDIILEYKAVK